MKIVRPLGLGLLHRTYRHRGRDHLALSALGFFRLGAAAQRFLPEHLQWPLVAPLLPREQPFDEFMPKARGEVLAAGSAHAPGGEPVGEMSVRLQAGRIDKTLRVIGDRQWLYGLVPLYQVTEPLPFAEMPLAYERAYGGPRSKWNTEGRGYTGNPLAAFFGQNQGAMPNLELPGAPVRSNWSRRRPAGFGPIDHRWRPRRGKRGSYGKRWLEEEFPGIASDADWTVFNAAPEDQQIEGFFQGGERYRLEGLHPRRALIEGELPRMRARAFVLRKAAAPAGAEEVALALETVWFFPGVELGLALYRGVAAIADSDALDVQALMAGYERQADAPRPLAHYREVLALRTDPKTAVLHAFNESQLAPEKSAAALAQRARARAKAQAEDLAARQALLDETVAEIWQKCGLQPPPGYVAPKAEPLPLGSMPLNPAEQDDFDLSEFAREAQALADEAKKKGEEQMRRLEEEKAGLAALRAKAPQADANAQAHAALARAAVVATDLVPGAADAQPHPLLAALERAQRAGARVDPAQRAQVEQAAAQAGALARRARRSAPEPAAPAELLPPQAGAALGAQALAWHRAGIVLAGRDLAGASLRNADFRGADLREVMLERADLGGASFAGADLRGAVFAGAILDGADFSAARLDEANFSRSRGEGVRFVDAQMSRTLAMNACWPRAVLAGARLHGWTALEIDLSGAILDGAQISEAALLNARAGASRWRGARLERTALFGAELSGADFSGAELRQSVLLDAALRASTWQGARLQEVAAGGKSDWSAARLRDVRAEKCSWRSAKLAGADLTGAQLAGCDFGEADLSGAQLSGALLARSLLICTVLRESRAAGADFFEALARKADFSGADLRAANFSRAELTEARFEGALLEGARLDEFARRRISRDLSARKAA